MVRCVGRMYGPFHHNRCYFPCYLCLLCNQYDDALEMPNQNVLEYYMRWSQSFVSWCFLWAYLALGLWLGIQICYNMNWKKKPLVLGPQKVMRRSRSLPVFYFCLGPLLPYYYIPCLSGDFESSRIFLKSWEMSWDIGSASETCHVIHPRLEKN